MSRGGAGRGGRGGARGGRAGPQLSWDNGEHAPDTKPSDLFPPYTPPTAKSLSALEQANVNAFLLFRRQFHDSSMYSRKRTLAADPSKREKHYGQQQANAKYSQQTRATLDPFTSVPLYSQKFAQPDRSLPSFAGRPFYKEFFPAELHATLNGDDVGAGERRRGRDTKRLKLSRITALPTAEDVFQLHENGEAAPENAQKTLEALEKIADTEVEVEGEEDWDGAAEEEEQDVEYDDEDAGDYDAENYFDDGEFGEDDGGGDDDDGGGEGSY